MFQVNDAADGHALKFVGYELLQKYDLISKFKINTQVRHWSILFEFENSVVVFIVLNIFSFLIIYLFLTSDIKSQGQYRKHLQSSWSTETSSEPRLIVFDGVLKTNVKPVYIGKDC